MRRIAFRVPSERLLDCALNSTTSPLRRVSGSLLGGSLFACQYARSATSRGSSACAEAASRPIANSVNASPVQACRAARALHCLRRGMHRVIAMTAHDVASLPMKMRRGERSSSSRVLVPTD